ncbi:MAG: ABC transporter ATP-binding protein [Pseudomonadota bacterium]
MSAEAPLLAVDGLTVDFASGGPPIRANDDINLEVRSGEVLGIVGESGSGKTVLCKTILRLLAEPPARIVAGGIHFKGEDLTRLDEAAMRQLRGDAIAMVFQNPMTSFNPLWTMGDQLTEGLRLHRGLSRRAAATAGIELLARVGIPSPEIRIRDYPTQWSGGMLQRAAIAMAVAMEPALLLADEPTTALDVTIQDQILALLLDLQARTGMALVMVSHDLGIISETCDRVVVMYAGRILEMVASAALFARPGHPYSEGLLASIPSLDDASAGLEPIPGQPPDLTDLGPGCPFAPRCRYASEDCQRQTVALREIAPGHLSACLFPERMARHG